MSFNCLKSDMKELIELSAEIATYNQMRLHYNDVNDKRNYNPEKCEKIKCKVAELQDRYVYHKLAFRAY